MGIVQYFGWTALIMKIWKIDVTQDLVAKIILAVIVVIMNYFFSKFIIFKKDKKSE